jgi:hypothetical protein
MNQYKGLELQVDASARMIEEEEEPASELTATEGASDFQ